MDIENEANPVADDTLSPATEADVTDNAVEIELDPETGEPIEANPAEDDDELDVDGEKVRLPKTIAAKLRAGQMMQADYTRKTQALAEQARALDTERAQREEATTALRADIGRAHMLTDQVAAYEAVNWQQLSAEDPAYAQSMWMQYQQTKEAATKAATELTTKEAALADQRAQSLAKARQETAAVLTRDIEGWNQTTATAAAQFAISLGANPKDIAEVNDPVTWKLMHAAAASAAELAALKAKDTKAQNLKSATAVQPAITTRGAAAPVGLHDKLPVDEWTRRRNAQLAKRRTS